jgi:hypothetical protein
VVVVGTWEEWSEERGEERRGGQVDVYSFYSMSLTQDVLFLHAEEG